MDSELNIIDGFDIIRYRFGDVNLPVLKKRYMYFVWKKYYSRKYLLFSEYYIEFHRFLLDFEDYDYFIEQNVRKSYDALVAKCNTSDINEFISIMSGYSDDIILIYLEDIENIHSCKCFRFSGFYKR